MASESTNDFWLFTRLFIRYAYYVRQILVGLILVITLGGVAISFIEKIDLIDGLYFAYITGLTIGYGDIHAETTLGRVLSVAIGIMGMLFTGITVAVANRTLHEIAEKEMK